MTRAIRQPAPRKPLCPARLALVAALSGMLGLAGCSLGPREAGVHDPYEVANRAQFERNLSLERSLSGGEAEDSAEGDTEGPAEGPGPVTRAVARFGSNLGIPSSVVNDLLQVRPDRAMENSLRFAINSTIGIGGLFDPAGALGLHGRSTDFGETLWRWGMGEGAYVVLPVLGPSTERDAFGALVDVALDPWRFVVSDRVLAQIVAARIAGRVAQVAEYADVIDANVIDTTDPYAQARLLYLQTRRYHLGATAEEDIIDPYADF